MTRTRRAREALGRRAELLATLALRLRGYRVLARRFRTPVGEIDLVARRGGRLAFVEVKARADAATASAALGPAQRRRIVRAAEAFLAARPQPGIDRVGFDLVAVRPGRWPTHVEDAWRADEV